MTRMVQIYAPFFRRDKRSKLRFGFDEPRPTDPRELLASGVRVIEPQFRPSFGHGEHCEVPAKKVIIPFELRLKLAKLLEYINVRTS